MKTILLLFSALSAAFAQPDATLESQGPANFRMPLARGATYDIVVSAVKGPVIIDHIWIDISESDTNRGLAADSLRLTHPKAALKPDIPVTLKLTLDETKLGDVVKASATILMRYRADAAGAAPKPLLWKVDLVRPAPEIRTGIKNLVTMQFVRNNPFGIFQARRCSSYQASPAGGMVPPNTQVQGIPLERTTDVQPDGASASLQAGATQKFYYQAQIPPHHTSLRGRFLLEPPLVNKETEVIALFLIKDAAIWRVLATVVAYVPALSLIWAVSHIRRRLLHRVTRSEMYNRVNNVIARNPTLAADSSMDFIRQLLARSETQDQEADFDGADQSLVAADSRLTTLENTPPVAPTTLAAGLPIRILEPQARWVAGRRLTITIANPPALWAAGCNLTWTIKNLNAGRADISTGTERTLMHVFDDPAAYMIDVSDGLNAISRTMTIQTPVKQGLVEKLRLIEAAPYVLGAVLAAGAAYLTTAEAETFGTFGDYFKLMGTAFGVTTATQALGPIVASLRR